MKRKYIQSAYDLLSRKYGRGIRNIPSKNVYKAVKVGAAAAAAGALESMGSGALSKATLGFGKGPPKPGRVRPIAGVRRSFKKKYVKPLGYLKPKGVTKKFIKKVVKSLDYNKNWGLYISRHNLRLSQNVIDVFNMQYTDERGRNLNFGSPLELLHDASVLFYSKADSDDYSVTTNNIVATGLKFNIISYDVKWFFKSTSSHVVNIEMYECYAKDDSASFESVNSLVNNSYNDAYNDSYLVMNAAGNMVAQTCSASDSTAKACEWVELYKKYNVKCRRIKLNPGDHTTHYTKVYSNKFMDYSNMAIDNGQVSQISKGMCQVFFRVINDATVSASLGTGLIHQWFSNQQGGVAATFERRMRMAALPYQGSTSTNYRAQNSLKRASFTFNNTFATGQQDQQVLYNNPISGANTSS